MLPHSILGCLKDFRTEMELRGETEVARHFKQEVIFLGNAKNYRLIIIILVLKV